MMRRAILLGALGVAILALVVGTALATPPVDQTVIPVTKATLGTFDAEGAGIEVESEQRSADIAIAKVVLDPGGSTGWHHIPGVTLVSVASGTVAVYDVKCEKTVTAPEKTSPATRATATPSASASVSPLSSSETR